MADKKGRGQPKAFESAEFFLLCIEEYVLYCEKEKRFINISGFCAFNKGKNKSFRIHKDTFYKQKEYYSDAYNIAMEILEDGVLQDNTYRAQLYLKNKFGYKDKQEIDQNIGNKDDKPFIVSDERAAEIGKRLSDEQWEQVLKWAGRK